MRGSAVIGMHVQGMTDVAGVEDAEVLTRSPAAAGAGRSAPMRLSEAGSTTVAMAVRLHLAVIRDHHDAVAAAHAHVAGVDRAADVI